MNDLKPVKVWEVLSVLVLVGLCAPLAHAQLAASKCIDIAEPSGAPAEIAQVCGRFTDPVVAEPYNGSQRGFAYFHAANANARLNNPVIAADLVAKSYANLTDASPSLTPAGKRPSGRAKGKAWDERVARQNAFKFNRTILRASSLRKVADMFASGQVGPGDTNLCSDKASCIDTAIDFLNTQSGVIQPYAATATKPEGPQVDQFHFLKAELIEARNRASDKADALSAYEMVMAGNSGSAEEAGAKAKVEALGIELGNSARSSDPAKNTIQSLADSERFYNRALGANPGSSAALIGKGETNLAMASLAGVSGTDRRAYYTEAVRAFGAASTSSAAGSAASGAAAYHLGKSKTAWADYLATVEPKIPADTVKHDDLRREAIAHYEAAVATSPTEAAYLRGLASAYKAKGEPQNADIAYRKAIAALLGSSAGAAWDVPRTENDRNVFTNLVKALPKADQEFISAALLDLAGTTGASADVLLAAKAADKTAVKPALQLAKLYARSGNTSSARIEIADVLKNSELSAGVVKRGMEADRAEAYFIRSQLASSPVPTVESINDADNALKLQPADAAYANWACVVRIMRGGDYVKGANTGSGCVGLIGQERDLLRGMFLLRAAQQGPANQKQFLRGQAQQVFAQGDSRLKQDDGYAAMSGIFPWWKGNAEAAKLRPLLLYGQAVAIACSGPPQNPDINQTELDRAVQFYTWHNAKDC